MYCTSKVKSNTRSVLISFSSNVKGISKWHMVSNLPSCIMYILQLQTLCAEYVWTILVMIVVIRFLSEYVKTITVRMFPPNFLIANENKSDISYLIHPRNASHTSVLSIRKETGRNSK